LAFGVKTGWRPFVFDRLGGFSAGIERIFSLGDLLEDFVDLDENFVVVCTTSVEVWHDAFGRSFFYWFSLVVFVVWIGVHWFLRVVGLRVTLWLVFVLIDLLADY